MLSLSPETDKIDHVRATTDWMAWLDKYASRIESERDEWVIAESPNGDDVYAKREMAAKNANPRFVLRQWVLEEIIARVEQDHGRGKRLLAKILHVSCTTG